MDPTENTFTINLVSNASTETYPGNSMASFTNLLPKPIDLNKTFGTWQVLLLEISWPAKFKNVTHGFIEPHMGETDSSSDGEEPIEPTSAEELFTDIGRRQPTENSTIFGKLQTSNAKLTLVFTQQLKT